jgi:glycosyltransferase involved in cell wall biosynthesis
MPKVSAIVSAYYAEKYLEGRLDNLLAQTPQPEIVVVCQSGSIEHEITLAFSRRHDAAITIVTTPDIPTVYAAWNLGIKAATGDYITNANSDDKLYPNALAKLAAVLDTNKKYAVVYSNIDIVEEIGGAVTGRFEWAEGGIQELMAGCFLGPMPMWRKSLHDKYGYFDGDMHSAGDYEFWMRIAKAGEKLFHLREVCGVYLKRPDSAEHRLKLRSTWEQARARGRYREGVNALWTTPKPMTG